MIRESKVQRKTKETDINLSLLLDGQGISNIDTGVGFFDHMLSAFCLHGGFNMELFCKGDLNVDCHHTVEDVGITLGSTFSKALGDKKGILRYGMCTIPMDEALATCNLDISNRPYLVFNADFNTPKIGDMETQMVKEFFYAFAMNAGITLHLNLVYGSNDHHIAEALFKAFAHALKQGIKKSENSQVLSTKGSL
ncbi:MAG: imidazoleglycerol-phosphate dehydratase HisB [Anaerovoracaceae bacterium]